MKTSPNIGLNIPEGNDIFDFEPFIKQNFEKIDENIVKIPTSEEFVATEGQTVFNLASSYAVGENVLSVEVDGVPQDLGTGFLETSETSITLTEGVPAGAIISVTTFNLPKGVNTQLATITSQLAEIATNVKSFGAKGDKANDDSDAIINALSDAVSKGISKVYVPAGIYKITKQIVIPDGVSLIGVGSYKALKFSSTGWEDQSNNRASLFSIEYGANVTNEYTTSNPFVLGSRSNIEGIAFYYPNQVGSGTPIPYPATIVTSVNAKHWSIRRCNFVNSYIGVDARRKNESGTIEDVVGFPIFRGIRIGSTSDITRINRAHFNPNTFYNGLVPNELPIWTASNGVAFEFARTDWQKLSDSFCWGYWKGVELLQKNDATTDELGGAVYSITIKGCGFDACLYGVYSNETPKLDAWGIRILDCDITPFNNFDNTLLGCGIYYNPTTSYRDIVIDNVRIWAGTGHAIRLFNVKGFKISNVYIESFGSKASSTTSVQAITVSNCFNGSISGTYINGALGSGSRPSYLTGILIADSKGIRLVNSEIENVGGFAIEWYGGNNNYNIVDNLMLNNVTGAITGNAGVDSKTGNVLNY